MIDLFAELDFHVFRESCPWHGSSSARGILCSRRSVRSCDNIGIVSSETIEKPKLVSIQVLEMLLTLHHLWHNMALFPSPFSLFFSGGLMRRNLQMCLANV